MVNVFKLPSHIILLLKIILGGLLGSNVVGTVAFPAKSSDVVGRIEYFDEDYPSDTHGGAVKAFSQLVSDDLLNPTGSRSKNRDELVSKADDTDEESQEDEKNLSELILESDDQSSDDSESNDSQYLIEELYYAYSYEEALTDDEAEDFTDSNISIKDN